MRAMIYIPIQIIWNSIKGYRVAEINGYKNTITFTNGVTLYAGDVQGDISEIGF